MHKTLFPAVVAFLLCSCKSGPGNMDDAEAQVPEIAYVSVTPATVTFPGMGAVQRVTIHSSAQWTLSEDAEPWCSASRKAGEDGDTIDFVAEANVMPEERTATYTVSCDTQRATITVSQTGTVDFEVAPLQVPVKYEGGEFSVAVYSNIGCRTGESPDWIHKQKDQTEGHKTTYYFSVDANPNEKERRGTLTFCSDTDSGISQTVAVIQEAQPKQEPDVEEDFAPYFYHRSLALRITADWCGNCPLMAKSFEVAESQNPDKLETVAMHSRSSSSALAFFPTSELQSQFRSTDLPTAIVDERIRISNEYDNASVAGNIRAAMEETEANYPTQSGIALSSSLSDRNLSVDVTLYIKKKDDYRITAIVTEDHVIAAQSGAPNPNDYEHNHIARIALTQIRGDAFSTTQEKTTQTFHYQTTVPTDYNVQNLRILVYVHRAFGAKRRIQSDSYGDYYVDNCVSAALGTTQPVQTVASDGSVVSGMDAWPE